MAQAFLKLISITLGILILSFFIVLAVRYMGSKSSFEAPSNPWFARNFWWIYNAPDEELCTTKDVDALIPTKDWIVAVTVRRKEDTWFLKCGGTPRPLGEFLKETQHTDWLLKVEAHDTWALDQLVETTAPFNKSFHFGMTTEAQKVAVYLRKKAPEWLFAADSASLLRLRLFESLYLETAIEFWPDFVIDSFQPQAAFVLDARMADELQRRKKRILWNWDESMTGEPPVDIQGVMTNRPSAALQKFGARL